MHSSERTQIREVNQILTSIDGSVEQWHVINISSEYLRWTKDGLVKLIRVFVNVFVDLVDIKGWAVTVSVQNMHQNFIGVNSPLLK